MLRASAPSGVRAGAGPEGDGAWRWLGTLVRLMGFGASAPMGQGRWFFARVVCGF